MKSSLPRSLDVMVERAAGDPMTGDVNHIDFGHVIALGDLQAVARDLGDQGNR
ncbi:hypothetical protein D3C76_1078820 [compost metagenome]